MSSKYCYTCDHSAQKQHKISKISYFQPPTVVYQCPANTHVRTRCCACACALPRKRGLFLSIGITVKRLTDKRILNCIIKTALPFCYMLNVDVAIRFGKFGETTG